MFAYLDPGSGSVLLQLVVGGIGGFFVLMKLYGKKLFSIFTFRSR